VQPSMQHRILDAPHLVLQRRPVESGAAIREFLREVARG
jgi:hypothetical protein